ncbi:MAG: hypothetical protein ACYC77_08260, partial [Coriobacteriia bacterium]
MSRTFRRHPIVLVMITVCALLLATALGGCAEERDPGASSPEPTDVDAQETAEPEEQTYTSWEVYINDEDSYDKD